MTLVLFVAGLVLLVAGAEALVKGAARLAGTFGIPPVIIGLTVVAFGTSAPELAVSLEAAFDGQGSLAVGNVVGSNILNVLLVLGASALVAPLVVASQLVRLDVPLMIGVSAAACALAANGTVSRGEGVLLFAGAIAYTLFQVRESRREPPEIAEEYAREYGRRGSVAVNAALVVGGLVLLVLGSRWLVAGALALARALGVSELVIGLTIVAVGTSLPEIATSLMAAWRGERDIAVGNVVGSNIFNLLVVMGLTAASVPGGLAVADAVVRFDAAVMVAVAVAALPIFVTGGRIARWEGALFLGYYVAYVTYLVLDANGHDALPAFSFVMESFVIPLPVVTLIVVFWRRRGLGGPGGARVG